MASIASQVILHPVTSQSLKVLSVTMGRDKVRSCVSAICIVAERVACSFIVLSNTLRGSSPGCCSREGTRFMLHDGTLSSRNLL